MVVVVVVLENGFTNVNSLFRQHSERLLGLINSCGEQNDGDDNGSSCKQVGRLYSLDSILYSQLPLDSRDFKYSAEPVFWARIVSKSSPIW